MDAYRAAPAGTRISGVVRWSLVGEKGWSLVSEKSHLGGPYLLRSDSSTSSFIDEITKTTIGSRTASSQRNHAPTLELPIDNSHTPCRLTQSCV